MCSQRCCWGFRALWAVTPRRWVTGSRRVYGWRCLIFKELLDPVDGTAVLRNIWNNSPINTASHQTKLNPRTILVWTEWTPLQQEVETHLDHRQARRRQESQTPLTEANSCPFCTSGTDAPVLGYPALQTTALTASLPKCELTPPSPSLCQSADRSVPVTLAVPVPWMCIPFLSSSHWDVPVRWIWSNVVNCLPAGRPELCRSYR